MDKQTDNIQVMVRVRPLNDREKNEGAKSCVLLDEDKPNNITIDAKPEPKTFKFDFVGGDKTTQEDIFQIAAKPLMMSALEGYNACIFAYGQTGAGKTFTMQGRGLEEDRESKERGVQPRVFDHLFSLTNKMKSELTIDYLIKCSYLEIYNEQIIDLLSSTQSNLMVREDIGRGVYIEGLTEETVRSSDETIQLLLRGMRNRHVGSTNMNFESSRSHSVFSMTIESKKTKDGMTNLKVSKLHFVDLAGSERQKQTAAAGERLKEASNINKSLTTLGLVINSLVQAQGKSRHISYRDSKLTFLLKDSLGGNSRTYMIAAVSAASTSFQETLSTLQFAQRAKMIKNKAQINEEAQGNVESLKKEIKRLKEDLEQQKSIVISLEDQLKSGAKNNTTNEMEIEEKLFEGCEEEEELFGSLTEQRKVKTNMNSSSLLSTEEFDSLIESNRMSMETEEQLKKSIEGIKHDINFKIIPQLQKKDEYINSYHEGVSTQESCENYHKNIMKLFQQRITNLNKLICHKVDPEMLKTVMNTNSELINEQYEELLKLMGETPNIMNVYEENVLLRSKLECLELDEQSLQTPNLVQNLQGVSAQEFVKNMQSLIEVSEILCKTIEDRKIIREKLEKIASQKMDTSERVSSLEDSIHHLKMEHNDTLQSLNSKLASGEQRELALSRGLEQERLKVLELKHEIIKLKESKAKDIQTHQEEIEELLTQFNQIDDQKNQASDQYELSIEQLNRKALELEAKHTASKQLALDTQSQLTIKDAIIATHSAELENLQKQLNSSVNSAAQDKCELENQLNAFKSKNVLLQQELTLQMDNIAALKQRIHSFEINEETHRQQFETLLKEKNEEIKRIESELNEKSDQFIHLQQHVETKDDKIAAYETDKIKMQEEIDILNDTNNYQLQEIEDKNKLMQQLQEQAKTNDRDIAELKQRIEALTLDAQQQQPQLQQEQQLNANESNINAQNQSVLNRTSSSNVTSPQKTEGLSSSQIYNNSEGTEKIAGVKAISEQNHQLRIQVEFESNQNITLRSQMSLLQNRATEVMQSEKHFRAAFLEVRNQLQSFQQKNKETVQNLQLKEVEYHESQKDLKNANDVIQGLQEKLSQQKNALGQKEKNEIETENKIKKFKETIMKLQETLRSKMDGLQQALVRNGELETKIVVQSKEIAQLRCELKGKCSLSEKRVQELIASFQNQRAEIAQMQKIINCKIEENIALTSNNRLLQSVIEKYTQNEWEFKQQLKSCHEKESCLKRRIDQLIAEYQHLEQFKLLQSIQGKHTMNASTQTPMKIRNQDNETNKNAKNVQTNNEIIQEEQKEISQQEINKNINLVIEIPQPPEEPVQSQQQQQQQVQQQQQQLLQQQLQQQQSQQQQHQQHQHQQQQQQQQQQQLQSQNMEALILQPLAQLEEEIRELQQIKWLKQQLKEKESELNDVNSRIEQIQEGIQQAQQYFQKYQQATEENKKLRGEIEMREHQLKSMDQQLKDAKHEEQNAKALNENNNNTISASEKKTKEKFLELNSKYQHLKIKYIDLFEGAKKNNNEKQQQQEEQQEYFQQMQQQHQQQQQQQAAELKQLQNSNNRLKEENQRLVQQVGGILSSGSNDLSPEISTRVTQLCEFVLAQLTQTNKLLLANIPRVSQSVEQNIIFILHAFNNLFEHIKSKDQSLASMFTNEIKTSKKISSLEKETTMLKKKLSSSTQQLSTAPSSAFQTPKASVSSVYKIPGNSIGLQSGSNSASNSAQKNHINSLLSSGEKPSHSSNNSMQNHHNSHNNHNNTSNLFENSFSLKNNSSSSNSNSHNNKHSSSSKNQNREQQQYQQSQQTELTHKRNSSNGSNRNLSADEFIKKKKVKI